MALSTKRALLPTKAFGLASFLFWARSCVRIVDTGLCTHTIAVPDLPARFEQLEHLTTVQFKQTARPSAAAYERPLKLNPAQRS